MPKDKRTLERQLALVADFFKSDLPQAAILTKHRVSEETYRKWQFDTDFTEEIERRIAAAHRETAALIARCAGLAATRLIELTKSPKEEIARKACLDVIAFGRFARAAPTPRPQSDYAGAPTLSPEAASKILAAHADAAQEPVPPAEPSAAL